MTGEIWLSIWQSGSRLQFTHGQLEIQFRMKHPRAEQAPPPSAGPRSSLAKRQQVAADEGVPARKLVESIESETTPKRRVLSRRALKASEELVHAVLSDIASAGHKPGDRLATESEMVQKYGVARATVREALRVLEINGMISMRVGAGGGPVLRKATPADLGRAMSLFFQAERVTLEELFIARRLVEPILARGAAEKRDETSLAWARDLIHRGRTIDASDDHEYISITREFHEFTVSGSTNRVFKFVALALMSMFLGGLNKAVYSVEKRHQVLQEHENILKAIIAGNAARAEKLMMAHMGLLQESIAGRYASSYQDVVTWE